MRPLDAAQRAFDLLTIRPAPLAFDCRGIPGLPQELVALDELKRLLIRDGTPRATRDVVWRELVIRARRDGPAWVVASVGIAMPGLRRRAGRLARGWHGDSDDLDSELLAGFLERLKTLDLDGPNICRRLIDAGTRAVRRSCHHDHDRDAIRLEDARSLPPARPWDHPDFVVARAVAAGVIGPEEGLLIGATRLEDIPLHAVAAHLQVSVSTAAAWRRRGEHRIAHAIQDGELRWIALPHD